MAISWLDLTEPGTTCLVTEHIPRASVIFENKSYVQNVSGICPSLVYLTRPVTTHAGPKWPRGLRRRSAAVRLLGLWVRIPPGTWMFVCCECCVLSGRGLCDELITRPEESYRLRCVVVRDLETS